MSKNKKSKSKTRVFKAPVEVGRDTIKITFPKSIVDYINIEGEEVFYLPVSGVIQISGTQPHMVIPTMTVDEKAFMPQEDNREVVAEEDTVW